MGRHLTSSVLSSRDASEAVDLALAAACLLLALIDASCNATLPQYRCCDERNVWRASYGRAAGTAATFPVLLRRTENPAQGTPNCDETCPGVLMLLNQAAVVY